MPYDHDVSKANRQKRLDKYHHLYRRIPGNHCTYCSLPVKRGVDHVPPVYTLDQCKPKTLEKMLRLGKLKLVPCCNDCNTILGTLPSTDIEKRRAHIVKACVRGFYRALQEQAMRTGCLPDPRKWQDRLILLTGSYPTCDWQDATPEDTADALENLTPRQRNIITIDAETFHGR